LVVAIDGPVAAGKTTVARLLASRLGFGLLDTGAIYRCVALACRQRGIPYSETARVTAVANELKVEFRYSGSLNRVLLDGVEVTEEIRTQAISDGASRVSAIPTVRAALLGLQRVLAASADVIAEGRDIGTVVFPDAKIKLFLTASPRIRANRRYEEVSNRGESTSYDDVLRALQERDKRDRNRDVAPLKAAKDAFVIDTSTLDIDEVVDLLLSHIESVMSDPP